MFPDIFGLIGMYEVGGCGDFCIRHTLVHMPSTPRVILLSGRNVIDASQTLPLIIAFPSHHEICPSCQAILHSNATRSSVRGPSALQLLSDLLLHILIFCYTTINAHTFALVQIHVGISWADALGVT